MNWEKSKALTPLKHDFLIRFFGENQDFFLTGGSALGIFYFNHRFSYDLDFFTVKEIDWRIVEGIVIKICKEIDIQYKSITKAPFFHRYELTRGDEREILDFVFETVPQIDSEKNVFGAIRVDTPREIGINKICTLVGRTELKDIVDLYYLEKNGFDIKKNIEKAKDKDGGIEPAIISYLLAQVDLSKPLPYMIEELSIDELRVFISRLKQLMAESAYPG